MDKLAYARLWDLYGKLLTPTQQEIAGMYFNLDLTVSEIADEKGISRQGVSDCLNICKKELLSYGEKLGGGDAAEVVNGVKAWAENFLKAHPEFSAEVAALLDAVDKN